jgi:hypothetical protein
MLYIYNKFACTLFLYASWGSTEGVCIVGHGNEVDFRGFWQKLVPHRSLKGTVQRELRWVKIGINRTARINCIAGKCHFPCPKGHHHESIINVIGSCSIF